MSTNTTQPQSAFQVCRQELAIGSSAGVNFDALMECVANKIESVAIEKSKEAYSTIPNHEYLFVISGAFVFMMQIGFAMLCAGCVRKKNIHNAMLKNLLDACGAAVAFWCIGFGIAFGGDTDRPGTTWIGWGNFFNTGDVDMGFWFFQYVFSAASVTIVAGTLAERCQMAAYFMYSILLTGFVYPVSAHAVWSYTGFLSTSNHDPMFGVGMIDFAGSGVVHITGGATALYASYVLGSRRGRFYDVTTGEPLKRPAVIKGHSDSLQLLGTMMLWFGWYGFNAGSALLLDNEHAGYIMKTAGINSAISGGSAAVTALLTGTIWNERRYGEVKYSLADAMNGLLSGLVAMTSGCGTLECWAALITGVISGWIYLIAMRFILFIKIDDAVNAIPVHLFAGTWGLIATGLFSSPRLLEMVIGSGEHPGWFYSFDRVETDIALISCQIMGCFLLYVWTFVTMFPFFMLLNYYGLLRSQASQELVGLDKHYHGADENLVNEAERDDEHVVKDYIQEYNRQKQERKERSSETGSWSISKKSRNTSSSHGPEYDISINSISIHNESRHSNFSINLNGSMPEIDQEMPPLGPLQEMNDISDHDHDHKPPPSANLPLDGSNVTKSTDSTPVPEIHIIEDSETDDKL